MRCGSVFSRFCDKIHGNAWKYNEIHIKWEKSANQNFLWLRKTARKSGKPGFHVFCFFTPLFGRFRLSRVFQTTGLEEIYRLV